MLLIFGLLYVVRAVNNANKPINDYSHAGAEESKEKVKFTDVAGADEEKRSLKRSSTFLKTTRSLPRWAQESLEAFLW